MVLSQGILIHVRYESSVTIHLKITAKVKVFTDKLKQMDGLTNHVSPNKIVITGVYKTDSIHIIHVYKQY